MTRSASRSWRQPHSLRYHHFRLSTAAVFVASLTCGIENAFAAEPITTDTPTAQPADANNEGANLRGITVWGQARTEDTTSYTAQETTVASKLPVALKDIPQSVSVVTRQRIEDQNLTTLEDALQQVTGVTVTPNGTDTSQYRSRGYALNSSIDGVPVYMSLPM